MLSDNRHYVFYLWKNLYRRFDWFRYAMAPIYVAGAWLLWHHEFGTLSAWQHSLTHSHPLAHPPPLPQWHEPTM